MPREPGTVQVHTDGHIRPGEMVAGLRNVSKGPNGEMAVAFPHSGVTIYLDPPPALTDALRQQHHPP